MNKYSIGETICKGGFGEVKKATVQGSILNQTVAIKVLPKKKCKTGTDLEVEREITIMNICDHPHIIQILDHFSAHKKYYIVMQYAKKGDLLTYVLRKGKLSERRALSYFAQIVSAIEYCHGNLITHRDLKLDNILMIDKNTIKLADFGFANFIKVDTLHKTFCGSLHYTAPEIIHHDKYNPIKTDMWSLGVVLYVMTCGHFPWKGDDSQVMNSLLDCKYSCPNHLSSDVKDLIQHIIVKDPRTRYNMQQIKDHPCMKDKILPSYLKPRKQVRNIDLLLVEKVVSLGYDRGSLLMALAENKLDQSASIYYLLTEKLTQQVTRLNYDNRSQTQPELLNKRISKIVEPQKSISPTLLRKNPAMRNIL